MADDPNFNPSPTGQSDPVHDSLNKAATTDAPLPENRLTGATTQTLAGATTASPPPVVEHPMAANQGIASENPAAGGMDTDIPVSRGNQHLVLGNRVAAE